MKMLSPQERYLLKNWLDFSEQEIESHEKIMQTKGYFPVGNTLLYKNNGQWICIDKSYETLLKLLKDIFPAYLSTMDGIIDVFEKNIIEVSIEDSSFDHDWHGIYQTEHQTDIVIENINDTFLFELTDVDEQDYDKDIAQGIKDFINNDVNKNGEYEYGKGGVSQLVKFTIAVRQVFKVDDVWCATFTMDYQL